MYDTYSFCLYEPFVWHLAYIKGVESVISFLINGNYNTKPYAVKFTELRKIVSNLKFSVWGESKDGVCGCP